MLFKELLKVIKLNMILLVNNFLKAPLKEILFTEALNKSCQAQLNKLLKCRRNLILTLEQLPML